MQTAQQWFLGVDIPGVLDLRHAANITRNGRPRKPGVWVETVNGPMRVREGDWIVTEPNGAVRLLRKGDDN